MDRNVIPMVMAYVDDASIAGRQQVSRLRLEKMLKRELRRKGYVVANQLKSKEYSLNLYNYHVREQDENTLGFQVKKDGVVYWVFYRFNGTMAIFEKDYLEACMSRKDSAPFFKESETQREEFAGPAK